MITQQPAGRAGNPATGIPFIEIKMHGQPIIFIDPDENLLKNHRPNIANPDTHQVLILHPQFQRIVRGHVQMPRGNDQTLFKSDGAFIRGDLQA